MSFSNLKVGVRLALSFAALLALMVVMAASGVWQLREANNVTRTIVNEDAAMK